MVEDIRIYNGAILEVAEKTVKARIRINSRAYIDGVLDTSPIHDVLIGRRSGGVTLLNKINTDHQFPEKFGQPLGFEDPRYFNGINGYTSVYRNGRTWTMPLVVNGDQAVIVQTDAEKIGGKNTCPRKYDVAYRPDCNLRQINLIPLEEFSKNQVLLIDPHKSQKIDFGDSDRYPAWAKDVIGLTFFDENMEDLEFYHGYNHGRGLITYAEGFALVENGRRRLAENPALNPDILDRLTNQVEPVEEKGKKVAGKDVVYVNGGKIEKTDDGDNLLILATRHDAVTFLLEAPWKEAREHWNDGEIPWKSAVRLTKNK